MHIPKLVIFDMDGLLFDSEAFCFKLVKEVSLKYGYDFAEEIYSKTIGANGIVAKDITMNLMPTSFPYDKIMDETHSLLKEYTTKQALPIKKGALSLINYLKENEIPLCVCSSSHDDTIQRYLEKSNLTSYFDFFIGGNNFKYTKPHPDIFLKALEIKDILPSEALVIEDSENGILAAYRANIPVICVPDMKMPSKEHQEYTRCMVSSLDKIIELF